MTELEMHHEAVVKNCRLLRQALDKVVDGVIITTPKLEDNPIVYVSNGFMKLTGYNEDEVIGRNCRFLQGEETSKGIAAIIKRTISDGLVFTGSLLNYKKSGEPFVNYLRIEPIHDEKGDIEYFIGSQIDASHIRR